MAMDHDIRIFKGRDNHRQQMLSTIANYLSTTVGNHKLKVARAAAKHV